MSDDGKKRILVVAAHPDDEILGCGATIAKHSASGGAVWVLILGEGITSRVSDNSPEIKIEALWEEAERANKIVGVEKLVRGNFPDNKFDSMPLLSIVHKVEEVFNEFRPDIVYTHHFSDVNIDHQRTYSAMQAVCRPRVDCSVSAMYSFEVPSSTEWNFRSDSFFRPNVFQEVEGFLEIKQKALDCYSSEAREFPHPRSPEYIASLAKIRGSQIGVRAAEAFQLVYQRI